MSANVDIDEVDIDESGPFVSVSITVSGTLPDDVVTAIRGVLDALRAGSADE